MAQSKFKEHACEQFLLSVMSHLKNGGYYVWPLANETYQLVDGKLKPLTKNGYIKISKIVSKKFLIENIIES